MSVKSPLAETLSTGRKGYARTTGRGFALTFKTPTRTNPQGLTPEHLFGAAWAACFCSATKHFVKESGHSEAGVTVTARVQPPSAGPKPFAVELRITIPDLDESQAEAIVEKAHALCAYARATRGNVSVKLTILTNPKTNMKPKSKTKTQAKTTRRPATAQRRPSKAKTKVKAVAKKRPAAKSARKNIKTTRARSTAKSARRQRPALKLIEAKQPEPVVHAPQPPLPSHDELVREQQKKIARAPQYAATGGFRPRPAPPGKPLWARPHSA